MRRSRLTGCLVVLLAAPTVRAGDWPQILGPTRNGKAAAESIASRLPNDGPRTLWSRKVGSGYSGVAVAAGRLVLFHRQGDKEVVEALDAVSGEALWKHSYPTRYRSGIAPDDGPRCVPVIHGGFVYLHGAEGRLTCISMKDGKPGWSRNARQEFQATEGYFGAGSTPIVEGDRLLVNVGGRDAGLVAFSTKTGKTLWKATDERASYSSPVATTIDGARHVIFLTRLNAVSVDPANGDVRFRFPFGKRGPTVNAANPLVLDRHLFLTASYGIGATYAKISGDEPEIVWQGDSMSSQYTTCVEHDGYLYGVDGRQDLGVARLRCVEAASGKVLWTESGLGKATLILADDKLIIMKTDGGLVLAKASPDGYKELATAQLFTGTTRALPALAGGNLYVRDEQTLKCFDLSKE